MAPGNLTTIIIAVSALAAVLIVFLLIKKLIKSFLAIILIAIIGAGCFFGIKAIDEKTNIRNKIQGINEQFQAIQDDMPSIKAIQCNHLGKDIGINVIITVDADESANSTDVLLATVRTVILNKNNFNQICSMYDEYGIPNQLMVGIKYKGLDIKYYHASLKEQTQEVAPIPDLMYSDFILDFNTGDIVNPSKTTN